MTPHEALLSTMSQWFLRGVPARKSKPGEAIERASKEVRAALARLTSSDTVEISRGMAHYIAGHDTFAAACGMTAQQLRNYDARLMARAEHFRS